MRREAVEVEEVTVGHECRRAVKIKDRIIRADRELKHHLIHLCIAVTADAEQIVLVGIEQRGDTLGIILIRKIISRTMIEKIAKENESVRAFQLVLAQNGFHGATGTVDIGSKKKFHR